MWKFGLLHQKLNEGNPTFENQNGNVVGIHGSLGYCAQIKGTSNFQCGSQSVERIPKTHQECMFVIDINLADNQLAHIKCYKGPAET